MNNKLLEILILHGNKCIFLKINKLQIFYNLFNVLIVYDYTSNIIYGMHGVTHRLYMIIKTQFKIISNKLNNLPIY